MSQAKLTDFHSEEKREIAEVFRTIPYMDKWIASLVENFIYTLEQIFYDNGSLKEEYRTKYGLKDGEYREWYPNSDNLSGTGKLHIKTTYRNNELHGQYESWFPNGQPNTQASFVDGKNEGDCKYWYQEVTPPQLSSQYTYTSGMLNGEYKQWYASGILWCHGYHKDNEYHGERKSWDRNGILWLHHHHNNGKEHGECTVWSNGKLCGHRYYEDGKLHGEYKEWDDDGVLIEDKVYINGVEIRN